MRGLSPFPKIWGEPHFRLRNHYFDAARSYIGQKKNTKKMRGVCFCFANSLTHTSFHPGFFVQKKCWRQDSTAGMSTKQGKHPLPRCWYKTLSFKKLPKDFHVLGTQSPSWLTINSHTGIPQHTANKGRGFACTPEDRHDVQRFVVMSWCQN